MQTIGVVIGNRDFFPDFLVTEARKDVAALFKELNITPVMRSDEDTRLGGVETYLHA
jgi:L-fucose isomerase-like protein